VSQDPKQVVRDSIAAFNERGVEGSLPYFHPEVEWHGPPGWVETETWRGHDGVREVTDLFARSYTEFRWELDDVLDGRERIVALARQVGRSQPGGHAVEQPVGVVAEVEDGKLRRLWSYLTWDEALAAEGLEPRG
jgi:ketosteroid isomerase-like protein